MLQINKRRAVEDFEAEEFGTTEPEAASLAAGLEGLLRILRRQFAMIAFVSVLTIALGVLYLFVTPLTFKAEALVKLDREKAQIFQQQQLFADAPVDAATVESEIQILKSDNIARAVIKSLHLTEGPKPEFEKPSNTGSVFDFFFPHPTRSNSGEDTLQDAVSAFLKRVDVQRVGGSYIIAITFTSSNPERAAQIANAIVDAYINYQLQAKFEATHRANVWLQDRLRELSEQSAAADQAVSDYRSKHDIVDTGNGKTMSEKKATDLNARLLDAQAQTSTAQARLDRIESILNKDRDLDEITTGAVVADVLTNPIIVQLRTKYLDLVNREADWSKRYGPNHLAVVNLRTQISEIRNSIIDELKQIGETY